MKTLALIVLFFLSTSAWADQVSCEFKAVGLESMGAGYIVTRYLVEELSFVVDAEETLELNFSLDLTYSRGKKRPEVILNRSGYGPSFEFTYSIEGPNRSIRISSISPQTGKKISTKRSIDPVDDSFILLPIKTNYWLHANVLDGVEVHCSLLH